MKVVPDRLKIMLRAVAYSLPVLLLILVIPLISWQGDELQTQGRKRLVEGINASFSALQLKFHAADLNGWQTAYAFDFSRGDPEAAKDTGRSRAQFLRSVERFRQQLAAMEQSASLPADISSLRATQQQFEEFMRHDAVIVAAYRGSDAAAQEHATALVMGRELELFTSISGEVDRLASAITMRSLESASEAEVSGQSARRMLIGSALIALLLALIVVIAARRWLLTSQRLMGQLEQLALTDQLTGVANRRAWDQRLKIAFAQAKRKRYELSICIIDIDHFKKFNDEHGHVAGDKLLQEMAGRMSAKMRGEDLFARFGGEEFVVLMVDCKITDAAAKIEALRAEMPELQTFSAGITCWNGMETAEKVLKRADGALYQAKQRGRNCTTVTQPSGYPSLRYRSYDSWALSQGLLVE